MARTATTPAVQRRLRARFQQPGTVTSFTQIRSTADQSRQMKNGKARCWTKIDGVMTKPVGRWDIEGNEDPS
jgi:hypothetical protein